MSRIAKNPISIPGGIEVYLNNQIVKVKGQLGSLEYIIHKDVDIKLADNVLTFAPRNHSKFANALTGTTRTLVNNMVHGVSVGFEKKLSLVGIGYRAQVLNHKLNLSLGFSHPVNFNIPDDIKVEIPSQTEIIIKGIDKQLVGQVAANIRAFRPPEPYKGKGVKYVDEVIVMKDAKTK
jgi:large subunit ribosomal protein L6